VTRINLLPPEITQKRSDERRWTYVIAGILALFVLVAGLWFVMLIQVVSKQSEVAGVQQQADTLSGQVARFSIFQQKQDDMNSRQAVVSAALTNRVDWSEILYEMSLIMPADVYLVRFAGSNAEVAGAPLLTLEGNVANIVDIGTNSGYDSVAKLLVRLTDLPDINNVWLTSADKQAPVAAPGAAPGATTVVDSFIKFAVNAKVAPPKSSTPSGTPESVLPTTPQP
jgi:Tfp pilus assembly protein PilN